MANRLFASFAGELGLITTFLHTNSLAGATDYYGFTNSPFPSSSPREWKRLRVNLFGNGHNLKLWLGLPKSKPPPQLRI